MPASSPPPDRFQREIDDIVRLAEKRLERQERRTMGGRLRSTQQSFRRSLPSVSLPSLSAEKMAGWGLALMLLAWLMSLIGMGGLAFLVQVVGVALLAGGLIVSLTRGSGGGLGGRQGKVWRGERISYSSPYGRGSITRWLNRLFRR